MSHLHATGRVRLSRRALVSAAAILVLAGCTGGGGDTDPVTCTTTLSFDRALTTPATDDVYLDQAGGTCTTVDIAVLVNGMTGIWSASFDVSYPTSLLQYQSYTLGPLLQKGSPTYAPVVVVHVAGNDVQVTMTRFGSDPTVSASGSEALITIRFKRVAPGAGPIDFDTSGGISETILDDNGAARPADFGPGHGGMVLVP